MSTLAERVKTARSLARLTQDDISELTGMSQPAFQKIESGKTKRTTYIQELASVLGVDPNWLATGQGEMEIVPTINSSISVNGSNNHYGSNNNYGTQIGTQQNLNQNITEVQANDRLATGDSQFLKDMPLLDINSGVKFALGQLDLDKIGLDSNARIATFIPHSDKTFGVRLGQAISGITQSAILQNDILVIEPTIAPQNNDLILLCLESDTPNKWGIIARYRIDTLTGEKTIQYDVGDDEPVKSDLPKNALICGVVVEIKRRLIDNMAMKLRLTHKWDIKKQEIANAS